MSERPICACDEGGCKCGRLVRKKGDLCRHCLSGHERFAMPTHRSFQPFTSHQVDGATAAKLNLPRTKSKGTVFSSEAQLKRYVHHEKHHGRDVGWRDT